MKDPFSSVIVYPNGTDVFPSLSDYGLSVDSRYTKFWASHYNKCAGFIRTIQPLIITRTASGNGTMVGISHIWTSPKIYFDTLQEAYSQRLSDQNLTIPGNVYPFEFVITTEPESLYGYNANTMSFILSRSSFLSTVDVPDIFETTPQISVTVASDRISDTVMSSKNYNGRWAVTQHCVRGNNHMIVRGSIVDLVNTSPSTTGLPDENEHWGLLTRYYLKLTVYLNRTSGDYS